MAKLQYHQLADSVMAMIELEDDMGPVEVEVRRYLNWAGRQIFNARAWWFRHGVWTFPTLAPLQDAAGFSITKGAADLVSVGSEFVDDHAGAKFAASLSDPWYYVKKYVNAGSATLERNFVEDTLVADATYWLYKDTYELPADCSELNQVGLMLDAGFGKTRWLTDSEMTAQALVPGTSGTPTTWSKEEIRADGSVLGRRLRLWPVPNEVFHFAARYKRQYVDMDNDTDPSPLPEELEALHVLAAVLWAQRLADARQITSEGEVEAKIKLEYERLRKRRPATVERLPFDAFRGHVGPSFDISGLAT